jgi:hypothetical protein
MLRYIPTDILKGVPLSMVAGLVTPQTWSILAHDFGV